MFTGIIDHCGVITNIVKQNNHSQMTIKTQFNDLVLGESIAIDGICLTVTHITPEGFTCDVSPETLRLTTSQHFAVGREVNLERALRVGDRLGGHWVLGHVDQIALVKQIQPQQEFVEMTFNGLSSEAMSYILKKGSIAVNGVSLTINEVLTDGFKVMLIPHTLERTNLRGLQSGMPVNIEFDWMARIIVKQFKEVSLESFAKCDL